MKTLFTNHNFTYACRELQRGFEEKGIWGTIRAVANVAADAYKDIDRTLVVVMNCPCCSGFGVEIPENAILVTPLAGIDAAGYDIHRIDVYPPFKRDNGKKEGAKNLQVFEEHWQRAIDEAVIRACPGAVKHHVAIGW